MSQVTIKVPPEYGYVLITASTALFITLGIYTHTGKRRGWAGIRYPRPYAENSFTLTDVKDESAAHPASGAVVSSEQRKNEYLFNCAVRTQDQNTVHLPMLLSSILITGVRWPVATSIIGMLYNFSRMAYTVGYMSSWGPTGRLIGLPGTNLAAIILAGMVAYQGWEML